jgi:hypothetical protein
MKIEIKVNDKVISIDLDDNNVQTVNLDKPTKQEGRIYKCKCGSTVENKDWIVKRHYGTAKHKNFMGL